MKKTISLGNSTKNFFGYGVYVVTEKKFLSKIVKKMVFPIFEVKLDFSYNHFFNFKLNIFQKFELW